MKQEGAGDHEAFIDLTDAVGRNQCSPNISFDRRRKHLSVRNPLDNDRFKRVRVEQIAYEYPRVSSFI